MESVSGNTPSVVERGLGQSEICQIQLEPVTQNW